MTRRICFLTGKRGGFGALIPTFQAVDRDPDLELVLIATDMHLSAKFGATIAEVETWVKNAVRVPLDQTDDRPVSRAQALGRALSGIATALEQIKPDIFVVLGDRGEVYAAVCAALHLGIPVAHIQGGDLSGNVDEMMRHAITKMSHIHFPSTHASAERIRRMGEEAARIHVVGDAHIDMMLRGGRTSGTAVRKKFNLDTAQPFALVLVHPETLRPETSYDNMKTVLDTLRQRRLRSLVVWPCSDHGYQGILDAIQEAEGDTLFSVYKNIDAPDFWGLQSEAAVFAGNSSAGLIEAPYFNLPFINIGLRQIGREHGANIIDVSNVNPAAFNTALDQALSKSFRDRLRSQPFTLFGDGKAAERMLHVLKTVELNPALFEKRMTY